MWSNVKLLSSCDTKHSTSLQNVRDFHCSCMYQVVCAMKQAWNWYSSVCYIVQQAKRLNIPSFFHFCQRIWNLSLLEQIKLKIWGLKEMTLSIYMIWREIWGWCCVHPSIIQQHGKSLRRKKVFDIVNTFTAHRSQIYQLFMSAVACCHLCSMFSLGRALNC